MNYQPIFRPIIFLLGAFLPGILLGDCFAGYWKWSFFGAAVICIWMAHAIFRKRPLLISPLIFFFLLGYLSIQPWSAPSFAPNHVIFHSGSARWEISGIIENVPLVYKADRLQFVLAVNRLKSEESDFATTGRLRVTCQGEKLPRLNPGDHVRFIGKIRKIRNFHNPGGFDYERFMGFKWIYATSWVSALNLDILKRKELPGIFGTVTRARRCIGMFIDSRVGKNPSGAIMKALVIGDRGDIGPEMTAAFNRTGLGHLLAISGLHVGIVAGFFFFLFVRLFNYVPVIFWHGWSRKGAALMTLPPVIAYGLLSGMSASTQRAVVMVTVFLLTYPLEGTKDGANTLALAALIILAVFPPSVFGVSFQLSFAAVFAIFYGLSRVGPFGKNSAKTNDAGIPGKLFMIRQKISGFFMVSLFAILGSLPLAMYYFNQVSLVGIAANFVFVPLVGMIVVPLGILSTFVFPVSSTIAGFGFEMGGMILSYSLPLLFRISELSFAAFKTVTPSIIEIILYYATGFAVLNFFRGKNGDRENLMMGKRAAVAASIFIAIAWAADISYWTGQRFFQKELRVTLADVGQGNAAILEFPGGYTMLIDGGGFWDNSVFDVGHRIIAPILWQRKIMSVEAVILTHPNSDHLNGLLYILENFDVKAAWSNQQAEDSNGYRNFRRIIKERKIRTPDFSQIHGRHRMGDVLLEILYPPVDFMKKAQNDGWRDINSNSLVARVSMGQISFLFTGDITADSEKELVSLQGDGLKSTVLVVPHHGSKSSSSDLFLDHVRPAVAAICLGWKNRFSFPAPKVLDRYRALGCRVLRTDIHGALVLTTDGESLRVESFVEPRIHLDIGG